MAEDSSSDSSDDFLVSADKLDLNDSFFKKTSKAPSKSRHQPSTSSSKKLPSSSSSSEDDDDSEKLDNAALIAEVMKNLEKANTPLQFSPSTSKSPQKHHHHRSPSKKDHQSSPKKPNLSSEITDLLLAGESSLTSHSDQENVDEKVEESKAEEKTDYLIPEGGVNIVLPDANPLFKQRRKCQRDLEADLIRKMNKKLRTNQIYIHKTGLICWLAHGFFLNELANTPELGCISLSLIPSSSYPKERVDKNYIQQFTKWFKGLVKIEFSKEHKAISVDTLIQRFEDKKVRNYQEQIVLFISMLRAIGVNCRLVVSLYPPELKLKQEQLFQSKKQLEKKKENGLEKKKPRKTVSRTKIARKRVADSDDDDDDVKPVPSNSSAAAIQKKEEAKQRAIEVLRGKFTPAKKASIKHIGKEEKKPVVSKQKDPGQERSLRTRKVGVKKEEAQSKEEPKVEMNPGDADEYIQDDSEEEDDDAEEKKKKEKKGKAESKKSSKVLSSDDEHEAFDIRDGRYLWAEVYAEDERNWICVDVINAGVDCVQDIYKKAPSPVLYVMAYAASKSVRDVSRRYCAHWLTSTRKQRVDEDWWNKTLAPWKEPESEMTRAEDEFLDQKELAQPLPTTLSECKGHPLYVLQRHLLKFEALYPPDCVPLGYLKTGEAIYSRYCVHTLRSRETWLRQARVVKPKQEAYKIVKSLPKLDKFTGQKVSSMPLELFGKWQTMAYVPPEAKDGIVPRNEYGNVDLFQQCMLPKGTVHIDLPGLFRVAKKLNIDCCQAVVGFNFGARGAMPMTQGYVVCEEFEETLREAWENEQVLAEKREKEKRDKRIWGNWRKLIKGLLIREKIAIKYDMVDDDGDGEEAASTSSSHKRPKQSEKQPIKKKQRSN